jgi:hypothetical protein
VDVVDRLITDLDRHPCRDRLSLTRTEGSDLSQLDVVAVALGLMDRPRVVAGGLLIAVEGSAVHLAFVTFGEDELVACSEQPQDFVHQHFVVT